MIGTNAARLDTAYQQPAQDLAADIDRQQADAASARDALDYPGDPGEQDADDSNADLPDHDIDTGTGTGTGTITAKGSPPCLTPPQTTSTG